MHVLWDERDQLVRAWGLTLEMILAAGVIALVLGAVLASMRVSPVRLARGIGTTYVYIVRNTPLLLIMLIFAFGLPTLGFRPELSVGDADLLSWNVFFVLATCALGVYTAAFICEALRSGVNAIPLGQAEAARSIGMTFGQILRLVILPQAFRTVIQPLANALIAMAKNSSLAAGVGVAEAAFLMQKLINDNATQLWAIFFGFALGYVLVVGVIAGVAALLERKLRIA
jgi:glutamate transport system permease protein